MLQYAEDVHAKFFVLQETHWKQQLEWRSAGWLFIHSAALKHRSGGILVAVREQFVPPSRTCDGGNWCLAGWCMFGSLSSSSKLMSWQFISMSKSVAAGPTWMQTSVLERTCGVGCVAVSLPYRRGHILCWQEISTHLLPPVCPPRDPVPAHQRSRMRTRRSLPRFCSCLNRMGW